MAGVGVVGVVFLTILLFAVSILTLYSLMAFWPDSTDGVVNPTTTYLYFGQPVTIGSERGLLLLVAIAGVAGSMAYVLRSFFKYVGERHLVWSWVPSYLLTPLVGSLLAVLTYIVVRAGLISGSTDIGNPFGFAAIAVLVGLFSAQAAEKLKQVFETMFAAAPPGSESIDSAVQPTISGFEPAEGAIGEVVTIHGDAIDLGGTILFAGGVSSPATWDEDQGALRTTVPTGAETGPLSVTIGGATATSTEPFLVLDDEQGDDGVPDSEADEPGTDGNVGASDTSPAPADLPGAPIELAPAAMEIGADAATADDDVATGAEATADADATEPASSPTSDAVIDPIVGLPGPAGPDPTAVEGDPTAGAVPDADSAEGVG
jgi:hypothetical protein